MKDETKAPKMTALVINQWIIPAAFLYSNHIQFNNGIYLAFIEDHFHFLYSQWLYSLVKVSSYFCHLKLDHFAMNDKYSKKPIAYLLQKLHTKNYEIAFWNSIWILHCFLANVQDHNDISVCNQWMQWINKTRK